MAHDTGTPAYFPGFKMYETPPKGVSVEAFQTNIAKQCLEYAIGRYSHVRQHQLVKINKLYNDFNGIVNEEKFKHINQTYNSDNLVRYNDYRLGRTKVELLVGEWLGRERFDRVMSINPDAKSELLDNYAFQIGLKHSAKEIAKLRENEVAVLEGMEPLEEDDDKIFDLLNSKRKGTHVMQILLRKGIEMEDVWSKLAEAFSDQVIASESFAQVVVDEAGYARVNECDVRDMLFEESKKDPFLLKTPYMGHRSMMFMHDIMANYQLTKTEYEELKNEIASGRSQSSSNMRASGIGSRDNGTDGTVEVYHLEWRAVDKLYIKESPSKIGGTYHKMIDPTKMNDYERGYFERKVKRGDFKVKTYDLSYVWEATKIGKNIYKNIRVKPNQIRSVNNPFLSEYSYTGLLFRTHDGDRISIFNTLDNVSELYNITMLQIRRELNKLKGKVIGYDRAYLPKGKTIEHVLLRMINDGIIDLDSSSDAAQLASSGGNILNSMLKEFDLGLSASFPSLIMLKSNLEATTDLLTGLSNSRQGQTPASMTATNAVNQIQVSRTATEFLFHMNHQFVRKVIRKFLQCVQLSFGKYHPKEAAQLLGDKGALFLEEIKNLSLDEFDAIITDGRKEGEIREMMQNWFPQAINGGEMRVVDAMQASLAETIDEAVAITRNGWDVIKKSQAEQAQQDAQMKQGMMESQVQMNQDSMSQERKFKVFMEILKNLLEQGKITQEAMNEYTLMADQFTENAAPAQPAASQMQQIS